MLDLTNNFINNAIKAIKESIRHNEYKVARELISFQPKLIQLAESHHYNILD